MPRLVAEVHEAPNGRSTCGVNQDVQPSVLIGDHPDDAVCLARPGNVPFDDGRAISDFFGQRLQPVAVTIDQDDLGPRLRQGTGRCRAESA